MVALPTYLLLGQSNAEGRGPNADLPGAYSGALTDVYVWNIFTGQDELLEVGVNDKTDPAGAGGHGPDPYFGVGMRDANGGDPVLIVKWALGASSVNPFPETDALYPAVNFGVTPDDDWSQESTTGGATDLVDRLMLQLQAAETHLAAQGDSMDIRGVIWWQGEAEAAFPVLYDSWEPRVRWLINYLREQFTLNGWTTLSEPVPWCVTKVHTDWEALDPTNFDTAAQRAACDSIAANTRNVLVVESDGEPTNTSPDLVHINAAGQQSMGAKYAAALSPWLPFVPAVPIGGTLDEGTATWAFPVQVSTQRRAIRSSGSHFVQRRQTRTAHSLAERGGGAVGTDSANVWTLNFPSVTATEKASLEALWTGSLFGSLPIAWDRPPGYTRPVTAHIAQDSLSFQRGSGSLWSTSLVLEERI